jgi:hypothetical protein
MMQGAGHTKTSCVDIVAAAQPVWAQIQPTCSTATQSPNW